MTAINYFDLPNSTITPNGKVAWSAPDLLLLKDYVIDNQWIILGGDVLTCSGEYTYDNWYYTPKHSLNLTENIHQSVTVCLDYVSEYTKRNGENFLFSLVLSNSFL